MKNHIDGALKILTKVFRDGSYSGMAFIGEDFSDMSAKLVYGVLEQNVKIEYILGGLVTKKAKPTVEILLKIGVYALENLDNVPPAVIVSECVECAKMNGKEGVSGFVNAVLKKVASKAYKLPSESDPDYLSVTYSKPRWFVDKLISQYGKETTLKIISVKPRLTEHVRANTRLVSPKKLASIFEQNGIEYQASEAGGFFLNISDKIKQLFSDGYLTFQSPSSMLAVQALNPTDGSKILDLCSAPGGKAVYMSELCQKSTIVCCDIHPHRIELIKKYAARMHAKNLTISAWDATQLKEEWIEKFDYVLVDAPCSCFGTFLKNPDVFLTRGEDEILKLSLVQKSIIDNALKYVKHGGKLVYSTCTLFLEENGDNLDYALSKGGFEQDKMCIPFENNGSFQVLPDFNWDGFYLAKLKRI